jgi:hypothetical protein
MRVTRWNYSQAREYRGLIYQLLSLLYAMLGMTHRSLIHANLIVMSP